MKYVIYFVLAGFGTLLLMNNKKELSAKSLDTLKTIEGFSSVAYRDAHGFSIGYGHFIKANESFDRITKQDAEKILSRDLIVYEKVVNDSVKVDLTQNMYDALVLLTYNIGGTRFKSSTLLRLLNSGNYTGARDQFYVWNKSRKSLNAPLDENPVLTVRRSQEAQLFFS